MKVLALLTLTTGITAMPWSSHVKAKSPSKHTFVHDNVVLRVEVAHDDSASRTHTKPDFLSHDICLKVCWPEEPGCPDGWVSKQFNDSCWTCCRLDGYDL